MSSERDLKARQYIMDYGNGQSLDFKEGWDQALQSSEVTKLREENLIMYEALKFYASRNIVLTRVGTDLKEEKINMTNAFTKKAREALEKVK